jgi:ATP-dependent helicase HrpA
MPLAPRPIEALRSRLDATFPADLPIVEHREAIAQAVRDHPVVVICGETGSGKSTQLPKICLAAGRGDRGLIGHTQPRRIAARSIAARIAEELGTPVGGLVGHTVRFSDRTRPETLVKVMTDGILLAETQSDRALRRYDTIIIDEAHERSLNIDFLLGYLKQLLPRRPELRVIVTSATIDPQRLSAHFDDAPIIEVSGRTHPVEVRYRPLRDADADDRDRDMTQAILDAVDELAAEASGDVLVFLSGEREIRETAEALRKHHPPDTEILPLYARLSAEEQHRVFETHARRRIVLATNVAETSLTVPGIRAVVDPGFARISRYSPRSKVERLPIEAVSQASADQRAGRCGRLGPGVCVRLYDEKDYRRREAFTPPEILRSNLASVILRMTALGLGDVARFPFVEPPTRAMIRDGHATLHELGAIDEERRLTPLGRRLARIPVDPRLGRMVLAAEEEGCLREVLVIAAALASQDPRERPLDRRDAADEAHRRLAHESSDFLTLLNLWEFYHEHKRHLSWSKLRAACREQFLSFVRMREWVDVHRQLHEMMTQSGHRPNRAPADEDAVHRALLTGLLSNIGTRDEKREFKGARGSVFHVFPASTLFKSPPRWVMAAEIVETTRRYARCVARIQPQWIERAGAHLLARSWSDPQWDPRGGRVIAFERVTIFGLPIVARRRVGYGRIDPAAARSIFIHQALVEGELADEPEFLVHNRALVEAIRDEEAKRRKRDLLVDPSVQYDFYDERLPADVCTARGLESWCRRTGRDDPRRLFMTRADLLRPDAERVDVARQPVTLDAGGLQLPLSYVLDPGSEEDGVTVTVPVELLNQVPGERLGWLVPAFLEEKITALIRTLPKTLRRPLVPIPETARFCAYELERSGAIGRGALKEALGRVLRERAGADVPDDAWDEGGVPEHLRMRVRVVDASGEEVDAGRDLEAIRARLADSARDAFSRIADDLPATALPAALDRGGITTWDFGELPVRLDVQRGGMTVSAHPALVDEGRSVAIRLLDTPEAARAATRRGLRRLFALACELDVAAQLAHLPGLDELRVSYTPFGSADDATEAVLLLIADRVFLADGDDVRTADAFHRRLEAGAGAVWTAAGEVVDLLTAIIDARHAVELALDAFDKPVFAEAVADVRAHLGALMPARVLAETPIDRLAHFPRYLKAISSRLARLRGGGLAKDRAKAQALADRWDAYADRRGRHDARGVHDPALEEYRWMLEEHRVSLFAQELGTAVPVSEKRLAEQWDRVAP